MGMKANMPPINSRQHLYVLLWMQHSLMGYAAGTIDESDLRREVLPGIFSGEAGRDFWRTASPIWMSGQADRRKRQFVKFVNDEYKKAIASGPPTIRRSVSEKVTIGERLTWRTTSALLGLGVGVALGLARRRR
jgi:hypothetical protein